MRPEHAICSAPRRRKLTSLESADWRRSGKAKRRESATQSRFVLTGWHSPRPDRIEIHRDQIIALATRLRLPNVYPFRYYPSNGGLASYGPDSVDPFRRAAGYVDRILKGEKPADLPVQAPTKYELVINIKTAKALGLEIPATVL